MKASVSSSFGRLNEAVHKVTIELQEMREDDKRAWIARTPSPNEFTLRRGAVRSPIGVLGCGSALEGQSSASISESSVKGSRGVMDRRKTAPIFKSACIVAVDGPGRSARFPYPYGRPDYMMRSVGKEITSSKAAAVIDEDFTCAQ